MKVVFDFALIELEPMEKFGVMVAELVREIPEIEPVWEAIQASFILERKRRREDEHGTVAARTVVLPFEPLSTDHLEILGRTLVEFNHAYLALKKPHIARFIQAVCHACADDLSGKGKAMFRQSLH